MSSTDMSSGTKTREEDNQIQKKSEEKHSEQKQQGERRLWFDATISSLTKLTPTVTGLTLQVDVSHPVETNDDGKSWQSSSVPSHFTFLPGQWVDFYVPALNKIGGYSITSLPASLPRLNLAVKRSRHPPAEWVTRSAQIGDTVKVRVGGEFVYDATSHNVEGDCTTPSSLDLRNRQKTSFLFVAGGVGINPLFGMLRQLQANIQNRSTTSNTRAALLYSASTADELLFEPELSAMVSELPDNFRVHYNITRPEETLEGTSMRRAGRITSKQIGVAVEWICDGDRSLNHNVAAVYICGPPGMAESIADACCEDHGIPPSTIHFEQWW